MVVLNIKMHAHSTVM